MLRGVSSKLSILFQAAACCVVIAMGAVVMLGWYMNWITVVQIAPTLAPMQFNTALGFFLSGLAVFGLITQRFKFAASTAGIAGVIGGATLFEYAFGQSLGIDELFVTHHITVETSHPGRMAPNTALSFAILYLSVLVACKRRHHSTISAVAAAVVFTLGSSALLGYISNVHSVYGWGEVTSMALHTAVGFTVLASVILAWASCRGTTHFPSWIPVYAAIGGTSLMLCLWQSVMVSLGIEDGNQATTFLLIAGMGAVILCVTTVEALLRMRRAFAESEGHAKSLERKTTELEEFVNVASHDLKSPLRQVKLLSRWAKEALETETEDDPVECLERIEESVSKMTILIDDLLSYAHAGSEEGRLERLDSVALVKSVLSVAGVPDGIKVRVEGEFGELLTFGSPLRTCLRNLLSNAVKHHDRGSGLIIIRLSETDDHVRIEVEDDGPGIPSVYHEKIFLMFETLGRNKGKPSTGLGLSFIKKTVETFGGAISVRSNGERGTTFTLRWAKLNASEEIAQRIIELRTVS